MAEIENTENHEHLNNAPIIYAVLQIKYQLNNDLSIEKLFEVNKDVSVDFPLNKKKILGDFKLDSRDDQTKLSVNSMRVDGYVFHTRDQSKNLTVSLKDFNYQETSKYGQWSEFKERALNVWKASLKTLGTPTITGLSLRFINRIDIKEEVTDPSLYFKTTIYSEADVVPFDVGNYLIRYVSHDKNNNLRCVVAQSLEPGNEKTFPFLFDIDVHFEKPFKFNEEFMWKKFDELRTLKNNVFFNNLTDKLKQIITKQ